MFVCLQNRCSLLNCSDAFPSREFRFGVCVAYWLHVIPRYVAVFTLLTGAPSRKYTMCSSVSEVFIVTSMVLFLLRIIPYTVACVCMLCTMCFICSVDLVSKSVSSAYRMSTNWSLDVCVVLCCVGLCLFLCLGRRRSCACGGGRTASAAQAEQVCVCVCV